MIGLVNYRQTTLVYIDRHSLHSGTQCIAKTKQRCRNHKHLLEDRLGAVKLAWQAEKCVTLADGFTVKFIQKMNDRVEETRHLNVKRYYVQNTLVCSKD
jgi:hypothetical protein